MLQSLSLSAQSGEKRLNPINRLHCSALEFGRAGERERMREGRARKREREIREGVVDERKGGRQR